MKSTIFTTLALASLAAAGWMGSFKYCRNNTTDTNPGCGTISFTENGCHQLPDSPQYNFTHNTHYIEASANVTYCNNGPAGTRPDCSRITFYTDGCHNFDIVNGVRSTSHLLYISANLTCNAFRYPYLFPHSATPPATMKFTILALSSLVAAASDWRDSVTYCLHSSSDTQPGCSTLVLSADGCYNLDDANGFRGTTHYISTSDNVRCDVFRFVNLLAGEGADANQEYNRNGDCEDPNLGQVNAAGKHFDTAASQLNSVKYRGNTNNGKTAYVTSWNLIMFVDSDNLPGCDNVMA
ncbi:hypothetical protein GE09DRAFT_1221190 [Coniochaeta sp. 2T2.1]|nr:hypothetical protein GE09DRAFT_1221190 [Coniochaeta sp. 2T2.1]